MLRIAILSLVILMSLLQAVQSCDHCDPDVSSRPLPRKFVRSKRETTVICMAGQFYDKQSTQCQPCQDGYFMTAEMAKNGDWYQCDKCQEADEALNEVEAEACTKTRDTLILCKKDFYRQLMAPTGCKDCQYSCSPCSVCGVGTNLHLPQEIQPCFDFTDTICCPSADMISENVICLKPTTTTLRHVDRSTAQRVDTDETRTNEPTLRSTKLSTTHVILSHLTWAHHGDTDETRTNEPTLRSTKLSTTHVILSHLTTHHGDTDETTTNEPTLRTTKLSTTHVILSHLTAHHGDTDETTTNEPTLRTTKLSTTHVILSHLTWAHHGDTDETRTNTPTLRTSEPSSTPVVLSHLTEIQDQIKYC